MDSKKTIWATHVDESSGIYESVISEDGSKPKGDKGNILVAPSNNIPIATGGVDISKSIVGNTGAISDGN